MEEQFQTYLIVIGGMTYETENLKARMHRASCMHWSHEVLDN